MINPSEINLSALPSVPLEDRSRLPQSSGIYFAIKERPLLMQGTMVRAILNGSKSQTRRLQDLDRVNQSPDDWQFLGIAVEPKKKDHVSTVKFRHKDGEEVAIACRYGKPGDSLWIRETWLKFCELYFYAATDKRDIPDTLLQFENPPKWKPSIFMPRDACRLLIGITDIRVERLRSITAKDAIAEGIERSPVHCELWRTYQKDDAAHTAFPTMSYKSLWDSINRKTYPWEVNPWVWTVEFKGAKS